METSQIWNPNSNMLCMFAYFLLFLIGRLKTWLRLQMGESRLTGLALIHTQGYCSKYRISYQWVNKWKKKI